MFNKHIVYFSYVTSYYFDLWIERSRNFENMKRLAIDVSSDIQWVNRDYLFTIFCWFYCLIKTYHCLLNNLRCFDMIADFTVLLRHTLVYLFTIFWHDSWFYCFIKIYSCLLLYDGLTQLILFTVSLRNSILVNILCNEK